MLFAQPGFEVRQINDFDTHAQRYFAIPMMNGAAMSLITGEESI